MGASRAMNRPAIVMPLLSQVEAVPESVKTPLLVRYVVNTKVVATALKAALPQSQAAHSTTWRTTYWPRCSLFGGHRRYPGP